MGVAQINFHGVRGTRRSLSSEKLHIQFSGDTHFLLNTLKGTAITLPSVILYYSTLSGTNRQIFTPKRYDEHPCLFYRGVPPGVGNAEKRNGQRFAALPEILTAFHQGNSECFPHKECCHPEDMNVQAEPSQKEQSHQNTKVR